MPSLKQRLRSRLGPPIQRAAFSSGLMEFVSRRHEPGGAVVLMYHSVADESSEAWVDPQNLVPARVFLQQMEFLARHRNVIPLASLVEILDAGVPVEDGTIVITFDDGYLDNLAVAAPILQRLGLPATIFLPTGYIDRGETQWIDRAYSAFRHRTTDTLSWDEGSRTFGLNQPSEYEAAYAQVCTDLLQSDPQRRRALLEALLEDLRPREQPPRLTMNWDDVRELIRKYDVISLGGHTVEHTDLTHVPPEVARDELVASASRIREVTGVAPRHFSFCYGRSNDALRDLLSEVGVEAAFGGCRTGPVIRAGADKLRLPRVAGVGNFEQFPLSVSTANTGFWRRLGR